MVNRPVMIVPAPKADVTGKTVVKLPVTSTVMREFEVVFPLYSLYSGDDDGRTTLSTSYSRIEADGGQRVQIIVSPGRPESEYTLLITRHYNLKASDIPSQSGSPDGLYESNKDEFEAAWRLMIDAMTSLASS